MNFIHQINWTHHRRKYPAIPQQQRNITSTFVDDLKSSEAERAEIRAAQHDLTVIDEYMQKAGEANVVLTSADITHNIDWLLAEAKRERNGGFTPMNAYNRLYSRIPQRQPTIDQVNEEAVVMQVQEQNVEMGHSITSPAHVLSPTRPRPLPIGVPPLEVALAALDNIQWQQNHQDDLQKELEEAFIVTPIALLHGSNAPTLIVEETKQVAVRVIGALLPSATQIAKADFPLWDNFDAVVKEHMQSENQRHRWQVWEEVTDMLKNAKYIKQHVMKHPPPNSTSEEMRVGYDKAIAALENSKNFIRKTFADEETAAKAITVPVIGNVDEQKRSSEELATANALIDLSGSDVDSEQSVMMESVHADGDEEGSLHGHVANRHRPLNALIKELQQVVSSDKNLTFDEAKFLEVLKWEKAVYDEFEDFDAV
jgi:hypothetical protein